MAEASIAQIPLVLLRVAEAPSPPRLGCDVTPLPLPSAR